MFDNKAISSLNETEAKIYRYVIDSIDDIARLGVRELANDTFTSTATVIRMYKKLGCNSFEEFKHALYSYFHNDQFSLENEKKSLSKTMEFLMSSDFDRVIDQATDLIMASRSMTIFGIGNSGAIARYGARYLSNVGYFAVAVGDPFYPPDLRTDENTLAIVVSESGETNELIDQLMNYKSRGAKVIVITAAPHSTLALMADLVIRFYAERYMLPQTYSLTSEMSVVYIFERLGRELFKRDKRILKSTPHSVHA